MAKKTCFVIMAIGDQDFDGKKITYSDLRRHYDDLIREALLKASPNLDIVRADDISAPGTITTDIVTRIMRSDYVVADVTYPNPNVFYELGLRHASRPGTIIIKDSSGPRTPFDISHLRHIAYESSLQGLKALTGELSKLFTHFENEPLRPDNHFLEMAKLTNFEFQDYRKAQDAHPEVSAMMALIKAPNLIELFAKQQNGEDINPAELIKALASSPETAAPLLMALAEAGAFK